MPKVKIGGKEAVWIMDYSGKYKKYLVSRAFIPSCPVHCHSFFEIEIILSGKMVSVTNGKDMVLKKGDAICLLPGDFHEVKVEKGTEILNMSFHDSPENKSAIDRIFYDNFQKKLHLSEKELENLALILGLIMDEYPENDTDENGYTDSLFNAALRIIERNLDLNHIPQDNSTPIKAIRYIQNHFRENISLEEVAAHMGLSPQYFCSLFHRSIGITFRQYLENLRVAYAQNIIKAAGMNCTSACYEAGFNSYSAFLRAFKRVTGSSPNK